ncbi:hypothetical protein GYH30_024982 [Glycine max]|nr:hypothetical protein GYH30_024982 [Glycine max]
MEISDASLLKKRFCWVGDDVKGRDRVVTWQWALASVRRSLTLISIGEERRESAVRVYAERLMRWALEEGSLPPRSS